MAGAQADRGGVIDASDATRNFSSSIRAFASDLLGFAEREHVRLPVQRAFEVHDMSLRVGFSSPDYAELCDRAYLPALRPAGGARKVRLAVLDYSSLLQIPCWNRPPPGLGNVLAALAEQGRRGAYDGDHAIWHIYDPARTLGIQVMLA